MKSISKPLPGGDNVNEFEKLLNENLIPLQRYVNFKIADRHDAEDVIQDVCLAATLKFDTLSNCAFFKAWLIGIAKHKCMDYYRLKAENPNVSLDALSEAAFGAGQPGITEHSIVRDTLDTLGDKEKQILYLYFFKNLSQEDISKRLSIPIGTVKSRLHYAKNQFRSICTPEQLYIFEKGRKIMQRKAPTHGFPNEMPAISIEKSSVPFFNVKCEEQSFIIPRVGNECAEATYRYPERKLVIVSNCYVQKYCQVHDVRGVKVCRDTYLVSRKKRIKNEKIWFTQLTDKYIRNLGTVFDDGNGEEPTQVTTFLEESYDVLVNGNDRVFGIPVLIQENAAGETENGYVIAEKNVRYTLGVWNVRIGSRVFETIKCILIQNDSCEETYIDRNGRVVLLRQYERSGSITSNDDHSDSYLNAIKDNAVISINGNTYIHTEDRISQYVL